jgi:hypothetical protein
VQLALNNHGIDDSADIVERRCNWAGDTEQANSRNLELLGARRDRILRWVCSR